MPSSAVLLKSRIEAELRRRKVVRWAIVARPTDRTPPAPLEREDLGAILREAKYETACNKRMIPALVSLLSSRFENEAPFACGCLWNIAETSFKLRKACIQAGVIPPLVKLLYSSNPSYSANAVGLLGALIPVQADDNPARRACIDTGILPQLVSMLSSTLGETARYTSIAIRNLAAGDEACKEACQNAGAIPALNAMTERYERYYDRQFAREAINLLEVGIPCE